jgi:TM2 domain-containing membrane protein YozV
MGGEIVANPILAAVLSLILPGLGQIYAGKMMMGIVLIIVAIILYIASNMISMYIGILSLIVLIYAIYDAYTTAKATEA